MLPLAINRGPSDAVVLAKQVAKADLINPPPDNIGDDEAGCPDRSGRAEDKGCGASEWIGCATELNDSGRTVRSSPTQVRRKSRRKSTATRRSAGASRSVSLTITPR